MLNHSILVLGLFIVSSFLFDQKQSYDLQKLNNLSQESPWTAVCFFILVLASVGLPSTGSFAGEFFILMGAFQFHPLASFLAGLGVIFGAIYALQFYRQIAFTSPTSSSSSGTFRLNLAQTFVLLVIIFAIFFIGIFPHFFFSTLQVQP